jgi:hypothetical protein
MIKGVITNGKGAQRAKELLELMSKLRVVPNAGTIEALHIPFLAGPITTATEMMLVSIPMLFAIFL